MAKVLLVEDDNNLREIYQARLMAEGFDIVAAQDGEEALVSAKKEHPDLIISDVMMPRISGFEMLDILRNTEGLKNTKVIMLTALGQAEDQTRADNLGANRYLVKSQVTLEDIVKSAQELLGELSTDTAPAPSPADTADAAPAPEPIAPVAATPPTAPAAPAEPAVTPVAPAPQATSVEPAVDTTPFIGAAPTSATAPVNIPAAQPAPITTPQQTTTVQPNEVLADTTQQTLEDEEAAIQKQINSFAKEPGDDPAEVVTATNEATDDAVLANAVDQLANAAPEPPALPPSQVPAPPSNPEPAVAPEPVPAPATEPAVAPAPPVATEPTETPTDENVTVAGKKVISPINDITSSGPKLDELLALESAKEEAAAPPVPATPVVNGAPATPPSTDQPSGDPNTVAL